MMRVVNEARQRRRVEAERQQIENYQDHASAPPPRPAATPRAPPATTATTQAAVPSTPPAPSARTEKLAEVKPDESMMEEYDEDSVGDEFLELEELAGNRATNNQAIKIQVANKQTERCRQEVEQLRKRQEEVVQVAIRENEESEMRVLRKSKERVEGLRRENQEREEKLEKERKEGEEKVEKEWKAKEEKLRREYKAKEEKLQQEKEEALAALTSRRKEREEQMQREKSDGEEQLRRENKQLEEEQRRKNEESLELLLNENEAHMVKMLAKQKEEKKGEEGRVVRKRKADQLDATNKQPAAPECPVCLDEMVPPTKIFHCVNGHHICETCKSGLNPLLCPKCRKKITGRASDMENFLKELLPSTSEAPQI